MLGPVIELSETEDSHLGTNLYGLRAKKIEGFIGCRIATQRAGDMAQWLRRALAVLTEDLSLGPHNQAGRLTNVPKSSVGICTHVNLCIHICAIKN